MKVHYVVLALALGFQADAFSPPSRALLSSVARGKKKPMVLSAASGGGDGDPRAVALATLMSASMVMQPFLMAGELFSCQHLGPL